MEQFEDYIENLGLYDSSPPVGHHKRFEEKLYSYNNVFYRRRRKLFLSSAASVAILIGLSFLLLLRDSPVDNKLILANETEEYFESELYFQAIIEKRIATIEQLDKKNDYSNELIELNDNFQDLKEDLNNTPGDQRVINAVLSSYMLKIETLDKIVTVLKRTS